MSKPETIKRDKIYYSHLLFSRNIGYVWNGEKRPPKKGEFFLSGDPIEAYESFGDLETIYHIARRIETNYL